MGFFSDDEEKMDKLVEQFHLEGLEAKDYNALRQAISHYNLAVMNAPRTITKPGIDQVEMGYLAAIANQNWIIIRQMTKLNKNLEKLIQK